MAGRDQSRFSETNFEVISEKEAKEKNVLIMTILNNKGLDHANFIENVDKGKELKKFSCEIFDYSGKSIKKFKKSDLNLTDYSGFNLADDLSYYYLDKGIGLTYPFTIKYEWENNHKNSLIVYPSMLVTSFYNSSLQNMNYRLSVPSSIDISHKSINIEPEINIKEIKDRRIYEFSVSSVPAIENERFSSPSLEKRLVYFRPDNFKIDNYSGSMKTWESFGSWNYSLYEGRDQLPSELKEKVKMLTQDYSSDKEKVKVLYDYLALNTRYVSIQLGIGGWQPMSALEVAKTGFGDCKALTNFLYSLLKEIGIKSYPTLIHSGNNKRIMKDFSNFSQFNHVILSVPLSGDTLWLECTNPNLPFGYIHNNIVGHDALILTPEGGKLVTLPEYHVSHNKDIYNANIDIYNDGSATSEIKRTYPICYFDSNYENNHLEENKQKEIIASYLDINNPIIKDIKFNNDGNPIPKLTFESLAGLGKYGTISGKRIFIQTNIFRSGFEKLNKRKKRVSPIYIKMEYIDSDTIKIKLHDNLKVESMPHDKISIDSEFGTFKSEIKYIEEDDSILIVQTLNINKGDYPKEKYPELSDFFEKISENYNSKIILRIE